MEKTKWRYFAACNSENGFFGFFPQTFGGDLQKKYIIKGGPGTGKSRFMRRVSLRAKEKGYTVEEIYCSSDPGSLDGIIARHFDTGDSFAVLDGTAPHATEAELPGARDEIINLGIFWDSRKLEGERDLVETISRKRAAAYRCLYHDLKAVGECDKNTDELLVVSIEQQKIADYARKTMAHYPSGKENFEKHLFVNGIGMSGLYHFPTLEENADHIYAIRDCGKTAHRLLNSVAQEGVNRGLFALISHDPLIPEWIDGILFPEIGVAWLTDIPINDSENPNVHIHPVSMKRFMDADIYKGVHPKLRLVSKCRELLMQEVIDQLAKIRELHFSLEAHYVSAMNFEAVNAFTEDFLNAVLP